MQIDHFRLVCGDGEGASMGGIVGVAPSIDENRLIVTSEIGGIRIVDVFENRCVVVIPPSGGKFSSAAIQHPHGAIYAVIDSTKIVRWDNLITDSRRGNSNTTQHSPIITSFQTPIFELFTQNGFNDLVIVFQNGEVVVCDAISNSKKLIETHPNGKVRILSCTSIPFTYTDMSGIGIFLVTKNEHGVISLEIISITLNKDEKAKYHLSKTIIPLSPPTSSLTKSSKKKEKTSVVTFSSLAVDEASKTISIFWSTGLWQLFTFHQNEQNEWNITEKYNREVCGLLPQNPNPQTTSTPHSKRKRKTDDVDVAHSIPTDNAMLLPLRFNSSYLVLLGCNHEDGNHFISFWNLEYGTLIMCHTLTEEKQGKVLQLTKNRTNDNYIAIAHSHSVVICTVRSVVESSLASVLGTLTTTLPYLSTQNQMKLSQPPQTVHLRMEKTLSLLIQGFSFLFDILLFS
jgi:hypothetical protein